MALDLDYLSSHGLAGNGPRLWSYESSADAMATIVASGYFNSAALMLAINDLIFISASDHSAIYRVATNSGGVVTTAPFGAQEIAASDTWDPGSISTAAEAVTEVTVTGAELGDFAMASFSLDVADLVLSAAVTAADTVTVSLANVTGGAVDLASGTVRVLVRKA